MSHAHKAAKRDLSRRGIHAPAARLGALRLGLCCQFAAQPIKFRTTTAAALQRKTRREQLRHLADLCAANADSLLAALQFCAAHGGGGYGDKPAALERFRRNLGRLSLRVRSRLTVENDDKTFTPADLLPLCHAEGVPLVYDAHHHRCCPDDLTVKQATTAARATWNREPLFHISSPLDGWQGPKPERHHDYIDPMDFPTAWRGLTLTVEVEAKAKELAVARLQRYLGSTE